MSVPTLSIDKPFAVVCRCYWYRGSKAAAAMEQPPSPGPSLSHEGRPREQLQPMQG